MRVRLMFFAVVLVAAFGAALPVAGAAPVRGPVAHAAATCADFPDQQSAQNAANTRDGDGDGIYCEDNPCPCSAAWHAQHGGSSGGGSTGSAPSRPAPLGRSITFAAVS